MTELLWVWNYRVVISSRSLHCSHLIQLARVFSTSWSTGVWNRVIKDDKHRDIKGKTKNSLKQGFKACDQNRKNSGEWRKSLNTPQVLQRWVAGGKDWAWDFECREIDEWRWRRRSSGWRMYVILVYKEELSCCMQSIQEEWEKLKDTTLDRSDSQIRLLSLESISSLSSQSAKKLSVKMLLPALHLYGNISSDPVIVHH